MEFFLEMLLTAVVALLISFLVAKLLSVSSGDGGDDPTSDQVEKPEIGVGGDDFVTEELRFGMKMDAGVIESQRCFRVVNENVKLVDRFESEGDRFDEVVEAATENAKIPTDRQQLVVLTAETESTAAVPPANVIAKEMIVHEKRDSTEGIGAKREELMVHTREDESIASLSLENVVAEETLSQGTEKRSETTEERSYSVEIEENGDVLEAESVEVKVEESSTSDTEDENEEKEELSIEEEEEEDDDWEGIERSELEKAFTSASNLLADESGQAEEISAEAKLELYGLHKIATEGACREAQPMAIMASARAKWNAWQKLGNMSQEEAMEQYLALVSKEIPALMDTGHTVGKMPELETSVVSPPKSGTTLDTTTTGVDSTKMFQGKGV